MCARAQICEEIGRQLLQYGRRLHPTEIIARIDAVDAAAIKNIARNYFLDKDFALAAIGAVQNIPDYPWLRRRVAVKI